MDSILLTVKSMLDVEDDYDGFDSQIIAAINNAIFSLNQLGVGPEEGFHITGIEESWTDLFNGVSNLEAVKSYIRLRVKLEFDTPGTSFVISAIESQLSQLEWRIQALLEPEV